MNLSIATSPDRLHGDEHDLDLDLDPFMDDALDDVIDTIMLFGVYPQPRQVWRNGRYEPRNLPVRFDLADWVAENIDPVQMAESYTDFIMSQSLGLDGEDRRDRQVKAVDKMLRDYLAGSEIVRDKAEELAEEAMEGDA